MAFEFVLARKALGATVLASEHGGWKLLLVRAGAMLGLVVAAEVSKAPMRCWFEVKSLWSDEPRDFQRDREE